jgi:hypothetical protein
MRSLFVLAALVAGLMLVVPGDGQGEEKSAKAVHGTGFSEWEGLPDRWKVSDDTIVGSSMPDGQKFNTFLCSKRKFKDFELSFKVKLVGKGWTGNSGVQIRSQVIDEKKFVVKGPQCDMGAIYWGSLYGELFGGMMKQAPKEIVEKVLKKDDFNDYKIRCVGKHVTITLGGEKTVDQEFQNLPEEGVIAWQMHGGPGMEVTFKDIRFVELSSK